MSSITQRRIPQDSRLKLPAVFGSILAFIILSSGYAVGGVTSIQVEGQASVEYLERGESEKLSFHAVIAGGRYRIRFHGYADGNVAFREVVFDGETSLMLTKFRERSLPEASDQKVYRTIEEAMKEPPGPPINDSFAILRLGPVPPGPVEAVGVWLAFAADTFLHSQPQHSMRRLFDPHAALRMGPTNVASYRRHSARSDTAALAFIANYHMHDGLSVTNEVFEVTAWTDAQIGTLPKRFEFTVFQTHEAPFGRPLTRVEYAVASSGPSGQSDFTLELSEVAVVNDERFWGGRAAIPGVQYVTRGGVVPPVADVTASPTYRATVDASGAPRRVSPVVYIGVFLLITLPAVALVLRSVRRGTDQS